jgi:hypothetical protein
MDTRDLKQMMTGPCDCLGDDVDGSLDNGGGDTGRLSVFKGMSADADELGALAAALVVAFGVCVPST